MNREALNRLGWRRMCTTVQKENSKELANISSCRKLSLSTNLIDKVTNLNGLKRLKVLSLGRNCIKSLSGIEAVAETLEELWISYNYIEKLRGITSLKKLRVLLASNNLVKDWSEINRLAELPSLIELNLTGNPIEERCSAEGIWRRECIKKLPNLTKLDGLHVTLDNFEDDQGGEDKEKSGSDPSPFKFRGSLTEESLVSKVADDQNDFIRVVDHKGTTGNI
ncbi:dynein axonemal light chain 1-like isoform X1 [Artemia franciscana]|uniref:dynein axonemal light chain 1-like isoform X1 n=1 Tax=Artemia franciscana TaxID=6661 RepID=UPI0032DBD6F3